jgi:acetate kinase
MVAALGGIDAIAFSGGIGEHSTWIHSAVAGAFGWLGVAVDEQRDDDADELDGRPVREISAAGAPVRTFVVGPGEAVVMADQARRLLSGDARATIGA